MGTNFMQLLEKDFMDFAR